MRNILYFRSSDIFTGNQKRQEMTPGSAPESSFFSP